MSRIVTPPIDEFDTLRTPLTEGEQLVFDFFDKHLSPNWEVYVQPHLNGLRPDFVLLNPDVGIGVFEVKDWNLDAISYEVINRPDSPPKLVGTNSGGKTFSKQRENPIEQVHRYRREILELYCPRLDSKNGVAIVTAGVIFPFAQESRLEKIFAKSLEYRSKSAFLKYSPLAGRESILAGRIEKVFPESLRSKSWYMKNDYAKDLRSWLREPGFAANQRNTLKLDDTQTQLVKSRTPTGYRRIRGPAGSGKSLVLAARAAELLGEDKEVLVVSFNITLLNYLKDLAVRWPQVGGRIRKDITWLNFHYWCKRVCFESDSESEYNACWNLENLSIEKSSSAMVELVTKLLEDKSSVHTPIYDAILVDEGQDFHPSWWNALRKACKPNGEMVLVADVTQDIYDTARVWTEETMSGVGFHGGRWAELKKNYRLPDKLLHYSREFAKQFLPNDLINLPELVQGELELSRCHLRWVQTVPSLATKTCVEQLLAMAKEDETVAMSEITFICDTTNMGLRVVEEIEAKGVSVIHTYQLDGESNSRRRKMAFYMGDARIKATTLHSFKGWESRVLVMYVNEHFDDKSKALFYTGLTRLLRSRDGSRLTVVSCANELKSYGKTWPEYVLRTD